MGKKATYLIGVIHDLVLAIFKSFGFLFFVQEKFLLQSFKISLISLYQQLNFLFVKFQNWSNI